MLEICHTYQRDKGVCLVGLVIWSLISVPPPPAPQEFSKNCAALWDHALEFGFVSTFQQLIESLDPLGETHALRVLDLNPGSSQEQIRARYRQLTKTWHPDRIKDPEKKEEAQEM